MHTQRQLLKLACDRNRLNYSALADRIGVSRQYISQVKYGAPLGGDAVVPLANLCGLNAEYVVACLEYHRAQRMEQTAVLVVWQRIAERFAAGFCVVIVAAGLIVGSLGGSRAYAAINNHNALNAVYLMRSTLRWLARLLHRLCGYSTCWCGARIVNGAFCENGHLQYRERRAAKSAAHGCTFAGRRVQLSHRCAS